MGACNSTDVRPNSFVGETPSMALFAESAILGEGSFGTVVCCRRTGTNELVAIKIIKKARLFRRTDHSALVWNERDAMIKCGSPFMVHLLCSFQTPESLYLVMPFHLGGDLGYRVRKNGPLPMAHVRFYLAEMVAALHAMHDVNVCHRDIKPDNVLIDAEGHIAITDFGLAIEIKPQDLYHMSHYWGQCGSYGYRAPEVVRDQYCGPHSDVYSLGATVYFLLYGKPPWSQTKLGLEGEPLVFPTAAGVTQSFINLIVRMLAFDPKERITLDEIQQHEVYAGVKWNLVYQKSKKAGLGKPPFVPGTDSFEFPNMAAGSLKNNAPAPDITPEQQACFVGFEWVPGTSINIGYDGHYSRTGSQQREPASPTRGRSVAGSSDEEKPEEVDLMEDSEGRSIAPSWPGDPEKARTAREARAKEDELSAQDELKAPPPALVTRDPNKQPGALSPLVSGHRMKLKHLRNLKEGLKSENKSRKPERPVRAPEGANTQQQAPPPPPPPGTTAKASRASVAS